MCDKCADLQRQIDTWRMAYQAERDRVDELKAAARKFLENQYWCGPGQQLARLADWQHGADCADTPRAWED